ncbi:hypothetical protein LINPERPRIM_LOCUS636, partial [Linum perenne]
MLHPAATLQPRNSTSTATFTTILERRFSRCPSRSRLAASCGQNIKAIVIHNLVLDSESTATRSHREIGSWKLL